MLVGPIFTREVAVLPRRLRLYVSRTAYVFVLWLLMGTAWLVLTGTQMVHNVGDLARFGALLFQILAPLQLVLATVFSALVAGSAISQEKDRRTLSLLLLTHLSNWELVVGKMLASLLTILVMLFAAVPVFMIALLLGGVAPDQIARAMAVTLAAAVAAGSLGATLAFWREKTFQTLAMTALVLVFWFALWEIVAAGALFESYAGLSARRWAVLFSPWQAILAATQPSMGGPSEFRWLGRPENGFLLVAFGLACLLTLVAVARVRVWNPAREDKPRSGLLGALRTDGQAERTAAPRGRQARTVWDNPILWREICTWAYGRKILLMRAAYWLLFVGVIVTVYGVSANAAPAGEGPTRSMLPKEARVLAPFLVLSLILVNALAVTSLTTERDGRALDLLLVTDLTPQEFVFGKLGGVFFNAKEMIVLPMLLCAVLWHQERISGENLIFVLVGLLVMNAFVAMLGIHVGMIYANSQNAIGVSLGTVLFLFIGVATCMRIMLAFSGSFQIQLTPFMACMIGGGAALFMVLGHRNPSPAILLASFAAPFATLYVITSFIMGYPLSVFSVTVITYGFATAAMLIPAIYEFDMATGRTSADRE